MPDIKTDDGCVIHVEVEGPPNGPVLMLSNSLGTNLHILNGTTVGGRKRPHSAFKSLKTPYKPQNLGSMEPQKIASRIFPESSPAFCPIHVLPAERSEGGRT